MSKLPIRKNALSIIKFIHGSRKLINNLNLFKVSKPIWFFYMSYCN